jgi:ATP-binding cassette subfamily B protein
MLTLASIGFDLCLPWASSYLIDTVSSVDRGDLMAWEAWACFVLAFGGFALARNLAHRAWIRVAAPNMAELTNATFARVQSFPAEWHASHLAGSTVRRVSRAMWGYDQVSDAVTIHLGPAVVVLLGLTVMLFSRQFLAGCIAAAVVFIFFFANLSVTTSYARPANLRSNALDARMNGVIADAITANAVVKSFGGEIREISRVADATAAWRGAVMVTWRRFTDVGLVQNLLLLILQAGLTGAMVRAWSQQVATPGDVAFAITAFMLMSGYLRNLGENIRMLQKGMDDLADAVTFAAQPGEVIHEGVALPSSLAGGEVMFEDVRFTYGSRTAPILTGINLQINPGETVAIVGGSGAGKSTLVRLLHRLYEPEDGRILIDGEDVARLSLAALRRAIAVVPQDPVLFHRSIRENIAYGRPEASSDDIVAAARAACAHDFIERLPDGYETVVGERGVKLSGGERQRIAIARAIIAQTPILVLDEATSALDRETEIQVLARLASFGSRQTRIVIAHRPAAIIEADRAFRLEAGRLVALPAGAII